MRLVANKALKYATRQMQAGDEFEVLNRNHAKVLKAAKLARNAPEPTFKRGPGRPRKEPVATMPEPEEAPAAASAAATEPDDDPEDGDDLDELTNAELMTRARERGVELPDGYIKNEDLIARLRA